MKWINPPKKERRKNWPVVPAPPHEHVREAHNWCQEQESAGGFYHHYTNTRWWFERREDAVHFALIWSEYK